jgi:hypothetical protein
MQVTVPILLALGIGVMRSSRRRRLAQAALHGSVEAGAGQALEGFGIVTLASLFPVLAVQVRERGGGEHGVMERCACALALQSRVVELTAPSVSVIIRRWR